MEKELTQQQKDAIEACKKLKKAGDRVGAVKLYRRAFNCDLKRAIKAIDEI